MIFFILLFVLFNDKSEKIVNKIRSKYQNTKTLYVEFDKSISDQNNFSSQTSGTFIFKKEKYFRFETDEQAIMTDSKTIWDLDKLNNQLRIDDYNEENRKVKPSDFLFKYSENHHSIYLRKEGEVHVIKLTSKTESQSYLSQGAEETTVWVNENNYVVNRVEMRQKNGNLVTYIFKKTRFDRKYVDSDFKFKGDESSYNVVDMRF